MPRYLFTYPKDDNDFRPNQRVPKQQKIVKRKKETRIYNRNGWDQDENRKYREFLESNSQMLQNREQRREKKVFLRLSQHVETRDANQCRSHHQKMIQKYKTIDKILQFLRYLEDRDDTIKKDNSTCHLPIQNEFTLQVNEIQKIEQIFNFDKQHDSFDGMFKNHQIDNYFNFMEDDIWLN